jgi:hypothetical protein
VIAFDPNGHDAHNDWTDAFFPECERFDKWIELWVDGHDLWERLYSDDGVIATAHYQRSVSQFTQLAAADFRRSAATEQEQRAAICRYFRRCEVDYSVAELIEFLGVSTPSILSMAGYSDEAAQRVMEMLADITEEEIQDTAL